MKRILLILTILLPLISCFSQVEDTEEVDKVILKNFSVIEGDIIEIGRRWVIIQVGKAPVNIDLSKVSSIYIDGNVISMVKGAVKKDNNPQGQYSVYTKESAKRGLYNITFGSNFIMDDTQGFEFTIVQGGSGVENITGYQFSKNTGLGVGIGYHNSSSRWDYALVPVFAEYRAYFSDRKVSPFFSLAYGATFGARKEDTRYDSSKPGTYFYPALGFKSGSDEAAFMIDLGVRFANISVTDTDRNTFEEKEEYKNVTLRIGVMF